jgi:DNA-binding beta-propeller fold protein YncE
MEQSEIELNREFVSIDELPAGSQVEVEYNPATTEVLKIEADARAEVDGTIDSIDTKANTVTILTEDGAELILDITNNTKVKIEGVLFGLTGLSEEMAVKVKYDSATGEALEIKAEERERHRTSEKDEAQVTGTVNIIDSDSGEVTITLDNGRTIILTLGAETEIEVDGADQDSLGLVDWLDGQRAKVEYDAETRVISEIGTLERGRSGNRDSSLLPGAPKVLPYIEFKDDTRRRRP